MHIHIYSRTTVISDSSQHTGELSINKRGKRVTQIFNLKVMRYFTSYLKKVI